MDLFSPSASCAIRELDLRDNPLGEGAALGLALAQILPQSRGSAAGSPTHTSPGSIAGQHLRTLNLANCRLDTESLRQIAAAAPLFTEMEVLLLYNNPRLGSTTRLAAVAGVQDVQIDTVQVSGINASMHELGKALAPSLRHLAVGSCNLGNVAAATLVRALTSRPALGKLDLSDNGIGEQRESDHISGGAICDALCELLRSSEGITLSLALNFFQDQHALRFAQVLSQDAPSATVDLSANTVSDSVWSAFRVPRGSAKDGSVECYPSQALSRS